MTFCFAAVISWGLVFEDIKTGAVQQIICTSQYATCLMQAIVANEAFISVNAPKRASCVEQPVAGKIKP